MRTLLTLLLLATITAVNAQNAYIQVTAEPGISVFLDNSFRGKTTIDMGGLIIENVSAGTHTIKILKSGFNPQEEKITIKSGEVYSYKVKPFIPKLKISESGNTGQQNINLQVGTLLIQSLPLSLSINIPSLGINTSKSQDKWKVEEIPVGRYQSTFKGMNKTLTFNIEIHDGQLTHLFVDIVKGEIKDLTAEKRKAEQKALALEKQAQRRAEQERLAQEKEVKQQEEKELQKLTNQLHLTKGEFTDSRDGNTYKTIKIGNQVWMAENLRYETSSEYGTKRYCGYEYSNTAKASEICPDGWHLPTEEEVKILLNNFESKEKAYSILKDDFIGFNGTSDGCTSYGGGISTNIFWTSTYYNKPFSRYQTNYYRLRIVFNNKDETVYLNPYRTGLYMSNSRRRQNYSVKHQVRCIKD
jgi:uncharacterized protein (TIGR02145 family)